MLPESLPENPDEKKSRIAVNYSGTTYRVSHSPLKKLTRSALAFTLFGWFPQIRQPQTTPPRKPRLIMKKREVVACLTTSLLVFFYVVELIFRPSFETFSPPLLSSSLYPAQFTIYLFFGLVFGSARIFIPFSRPFLAAMIVTGKLTLVSRKVSGDASISPFTPQCIRTFFSLSPLAFVPECFRAFPQLSNRNNPYPFFLSMCEAWLEVPTRHQPCSKAEVSLTPPFPEATRLPGSFFRATHQ